MLKDDKRNFFVAIALSILVIVVWQYFIAGPQMQAEKARQQAAQTQSQTLPGQTVQGQAREPNAVTPASPAGTQQNPGLAPTNAANQPEVIRSRTDALAQSPRVTIDTKSLKGSISLRGARFDDISLKAYRETIDPKSENITLFSPSGSAHPYFAESGFVAQPGANVVLPNAQTLWTASSQTLDVGKPVTLSWDNGAGLVFKREISVDDLYLFTIKNTVENKTAAPVTLFPYAQISRLGKPKTDGYAVLHEGFVGVVGDSRVQEYTYDSIEKETGASKSYAKGIGGWLGFTDKYWAAAIVPDQAQTFDGRFVSVPTGTSKTYQTDALGEAKTIAPGASLDVSSRLFAGAKETGVIDDYQSKLGIKNFDLMIDWGWFYFITKPLFWVIDFFYKIVGNFGVAILIVTVLVKLVFFPLASRSYLSMAKMKAAQPQMEKIREQFKDDKQKQQMELMELYKREKINPVAGCLPVVIQIPVFFALYKVIFITIEMRQAPFFGWVKDLSAPDPTNLFNLFGLIPFDPTHLPVIGSFLAIGIWPLIMGVTMFLQMKMNPEPTDPVQKQMFAWMPVIFTFMLGTFPAGLVIYWTWNNILSVAQQSFIMKRAGVKLELWDNITGMFRKKAAT